MERFDDTGDSQHGRALKPRRASGYDRSGVHCGIENCPAEDRARACCTRNTREWRKRAVLLATDEADGPILSGRRQMEGCGLESRQPRHAPHGGETPPSAEATARRDL